MFWGHAGIIYQYTSSALALKTFTILKLLDFLDPSMPMTSILLGVIVDGVQIAVA